MEDHTLYLKPTEFLNFETPVFEKYMSDILNITGKKEQLLAFYLKVRDGSLYDPYHLDLRPSALKASDIISKKRAWCVEKSIVFAAGARFIGVPSRLGYAVVRNHIGVEKLEKYLKRPEIVFHGYVEVYLNEKWVSCTPAFDQRICRISGVPPLDFDGENPSMFQKYSGEQLFMEYLHHYGTFDDVPLQLMNDEMQKYYPHLFEGEWNEKAFSFFHI